MKCIRSRSTDPYFNLAAEEYLLKKFQGDIYFQYANSPSVIVGKHQNALAEIDLDYLENSSILLARRISGGGAVYHDEGNVNYSFITNEEPGDFIKFKKYTAPIVEIIGQLGVEASLGKRNEILVGNEKISGTASHVFKGRVLHHGTLLYNADLNALSKCLYVNAARFSDKAVKSVRSKVINIEGLLKKEMRREDFYNFLFTSMMDLFVGSEEIHFSEDDVQAIEVLINDKFNTWEWNYGYSPKYVVESDVIINSAQFKIVVEVSKGIIEHLEIDGDLEIDIKSSLDKLIGVRHQRTVVEEKLSGIIKDGSSRLTILDSLF